jgi:hypothetical protein
MYRGFNLVIAEAERGAFRDRRVGDRAQSAIERVLELDGLKRHVASRQIDGDEVKEAWFKGMPADIFLSHSGADRDLAYGVADYLKEALKLNVFVDSRVWGGADKLLRTIDDENCRQKNSENYSYLKRNYSTSHVYMMLATALTEMIDSCECVIFLNTPASIQIEDAKEKSGERVASPWIYHELMMTKLIRRRLDRETGELWESASLEGGHAQDQALRISYGAPLDHLRRLNGRDLNGWGSQPLESKDALDWLYQKHEPAEAELPLIRNSPLIVR